MKKLLYILAMAWVAVSCAPEQEHEPTVTNTVRFRLQKPQAITATSASTNLLVWEVYDQDGNIVTGLSSANQDAFASGLTQNIDIDLLKGQTYTVVFWAQNSACTAYDLDNGLQNITITYGAANDMNTDAFFGVKNLTSTGEGIEEVTLSRPFAQINLVAPQATWETAGWTNLQSAMAIQQAATGFNALTGETSAPADIVLTAAPATELLQDGNNITIDGNTYKHLAMAFVLPNADSPAADITFTLTHDGGEKEILSENTTIQRNFRTNLITNELKPKPLMERIAAGGKVTVTNSDPETAIDFNGLAIASDLHLIVKKDIALTIGNHTGATSVTIEFAEGVTATYNQNSNVTGYKIVYPQGVTYTITEKLYEISKKEGLLWVNDHAFATSKNAYKLTDNIDMAGVIWLSKIGSAVDFTFDGNGKTISNWVTTDRALLVPHSTYDFTITNLTLENCEVNNPNGHTDGNNGAGLLVGFADANDEVVIENCHIINGKVTGYDWTAGFLGYSSSEKLTITNCSIESSTIVGGGSTGAIAGHVVGGGATTTADLLNITVTSSSISGEREDKTGAIVGTAHVGTTTITTIDISGNTLLDVASNKPVGRVVSGTCYIDGAQYIADGVTIAADGKYNISNANGMFYLANQVNVSKKTFSGETVVLTQDINLNNQAWEPIGQTGATQFLGIFDGNSKTISNLTIAANKRTATGLFGWLNMATVKNLTINTATIAGYYAVGTIAGYLEGSGCNITDCHVINATVSGTYLEGDYEGDKVGGIVGYAGNANTPVTNCTITNSKIDAVRDAGQVAGAATTANVTGCSATAVTVTHNESAPDTYAKDGQNINEAIIGRVL